MKKMILTFLLGFLLGGTGYWIMRDGPMAERLKQQRTIGKAIDMIEDKVLERAANDVREEMTRDGKVVMTKASARVIPTEDNLLENLVKAKLAADPSLANSSIKSSATASQVELRGTAISYDQVARAMRLALECDGAGKVTSTIEVKGP